MTEKYLSCFRERRHAESHTVPCLSVSHYTLIREESWPNTSTQSHALSSAAKEKMVFTSQSLYFSHPSFNFSSILSIFFLLYPVTVSSLLGLFFFQDYRFLPLQPLFISKGICKANEDCAFCVLFASLFISFFSIFIPFLTRSRYPLSFLTCAIPQSYIPAFFHQFLLAE